MKRIILFAFCFAFLARAEAQYQTVTVTGQTATVGTNKKLRFVWGSNIFNISDSIAAVANTTIPAGPITSLPTIGFNPGSNITAGQWITGAYYQSQVPTAALTGGVAQERLPTGANLSYTLNYSYGRQSSTQPIKSDGTGVVITGASQSYAPTVTAGVPAAGATVNSTQGVTVPRNVTSTFTNTVTTTDGKIAIATTPFSFYDRRYVGFATSALQGDGTPTDANIIAAQFKDNNGANIQITTTLAQQGSDRYMFVATTAPINNITINGFPQNAAFNLNITRTFVNAAGGSQTYYISVSKNPFGSVGTSAVITN